MTKKELNLKLLQEFLNPTDAQGKSILDIIDEFFDSSVCISKGENRHQYADVLHEWIEGAELQGIVHGRSVDIRNSKSVMGKDEYRIKLSEPIYEWQYTTISCGIRLFTQLMTDKEFQDSSLQYDYWVKLEETKRIRQ